MIWRFGKKQLSDVVKVQQFLEKEGIDYELLLDNIDVQIGEGTPVAPGAPVPANPNPAPTHDPAWDPAKHDGKVCTDRNCKVPQHYFPEVIE